MKLDRKKWNTGAALVLAAAFLSACAQTAPETAAETVAETSAETPAPSETEAASASSQEEALLVEIPDTAVPLAAAPGGIRLPSAPGTVTYKNDKVLMDCSNISEGYIMVKYTGSVGKIKVQVIKSGAETYSYDLKSGGFETFPLSEGSGTYQVKVFENISGNQYAQAFSQSVSANISNAFGPFLYPNQYVNFTAASQAVAIATQLAQGQADQLGVVTAVYNYVVNNLSYDTAKAATVQIGYLPDVDSVLASRKGICFDYAALMTAMLRSQGIPTKLVIGYTGNIYHAWINVYLDSQGWVNNVIYFDGTDWKLMDPTFASSGNQTSEVMQYIGDGTNYQAKYSY